MATSEPRATDLLCRGCGGAIVVSTWESSDGAFEDQHYACTDCTLNWWVDGPDA